MRKFPIVFTCDNNYFKYTFVVIASILHNSNKNIFYEFNVISEDISRENEIKAEKYIKKHKNAVIKFVKLENIDKAQFHLNSYMSVATYYRFYIPEIFKAYERILYLDSDLIVDCDISELLNASFEDRLALCCSSPFILKKIKRKNSEDFPIEYFTNVLKMNNPEEYFNAGVMVYNVRKSLELNIQEKLFTSLSEIEKPKLQDQDLLNSVLSRNGGIKLIDQKYNLTRAYKITFNRILFNAVKKKLNLKLKNPLFYIYHYVGKEKPWMKHDIDSHLFYYYAVKSPFYAEIVKENPSVKLNSLTKLLYKII